MPGRGIIVIGVSAGGAEAHLPELDSPARPRDPAVCPPSIYTCPECSSTLFELRDGDLVRYRCRVGHAYSANSLLAEQSEALEAALWAALRALEENISLAHRLTERAHDQGHAMAAARFAEQARDARLRADIVRQALLNGQPNLVPEPDGAGEARPESV